MKQYELTGGARIGIANVSMPFAKLKVSNDKLELNASLIGNLVFQAKDIIAIEPYTLIPVLGHGIRIHHRVSNYKEKVIFWTLKNPETVINEIQKTGFLENINTPTMEENLAILTKQKQGVFPIKTRAAIVVFLLWNALFAIDFLAFTSNPEMEIPLGNGVLMATGLLFTAGLLMFWSEPFRKMILKEGRELDDVKLVLYLLLFVSGFMFLGIYTALRMS